MYSCVGGVVIAGPKGAATGAMNFEVPNEWEAAASVDKAGEMVPDIMLCGTQPRNIEVPP